MDATTIPPDTDIHPPPPEFFNNIKQHIDAQLKSNTFYYKQKLIEANNKIIKKDEHIEKLKMTIDKERLKLSILSYLLKNKADIDFTQYIEDDDEGLKIYPLKEDIPGITIFIKGLPYTITVGNNEVKTPIVNNKTKDRDDAGGGGGNNNTSSNKPVKIKKNISSIPYRNAPKTSVDVLPEETPEQQEAKIKQAKIDLDNIAQQHNLNCSSKEQNETLSAIEVIFLEIPKKHIYSKLFQSMKIERVKLLGQYDIAEYTRVLEEHVARLQHIFVNKKCDEKNIKKYISQALTPLEQRLIFYGTYYNTEIQSDDIQKLMACLKVSHDHPTRYVPFSYSAFYERACCYAVSLCSISKLLYTIMINPNGYNNIVYIKPKHPNEDDDPYRFFILDKIDGTKRCWKLDCRLENFSGLLSNQLITYCVSLFRKIYLSIFNDNLYRDNYASQAPIASTDCEQLLLNVIDLTKQKYFRNMLRSLIVGNCTLEPAADDKFDHFGDDKLQKKNFAEEPDIPAKDLTYSIMRLFDNMTDEEAEKIWTGKEAERNLD